MHFCINRCTTGLRFHPEPYAPICIILHQDTWSIRTLRLMTLSGWNGIRNVKKSQKVNARSLNPPRFGRRAVGFSFAEWLETNYARSYSLRWPRSYGVRTKSRVWRCVSIKMHSLRMYLGIRIRMIFAESKIFIARYDVGRQKSNYVGLNVHR